MLVLFLVVFAIQVQLVSGFHLFSISRYKWKHFSKQIDDIPVTTIRPDESGRLPPAIEYMLGIQPKEARPQFKSFKRKEVKLYEKRLKEEKIARRVARQPHYAERFKSYNETETIRRLHAKLDEKFAGKKDLIAEAERRALPFKGFGARPVYATNIIEPQEPDLEEDPTIQRRPSYLNQPIEVPSDLYERKPEDGKLTSRPSAYDEDDDAFFYNQFNDEEEYEEEEEEYVDGEGEHSTRSNLGHDADFENTLEDKEDDDDYIYDREYDANGNLVRRVKPRKKMNPNPKNLTRSGPLNVLGGYRFRRPPPVDPELVERQRAEELKKEKQLAETKIAKRQKRIEVEKSQYVPFLFKSSAQSAEDGEEGDNDDAADSEDEDTEEQQQQQPEEKDADDLFVQSSFAELGITNRVILNNLNRMGVTAPTKVQGLVIPELMKGNKDIVIEAQTGSGKTLAFLLPLIATVDPLKKKIQAIIIASSRELVMQISEVAESLFAGTPFEVLSVIGGANARHQIGTLKEEKPQIIIATPGRLAEMVFGMERIHLGNVRAVVIDEVDHLLQEPYSREIEGILSAVPMLHRSNAAQERDKRRGSVPHPNYDYRRMVCFASATGNSSLVRDFCNRHCRENWQVLSVQSRSRLPASITHCMITVPRIRSLEWLVRVLNAQPAVQSALIFVSDPHRVEFLAKKLLEYKKIAAPLHGDATKDDRKEILQRLRDGRVQLVITTEIAARGLDIPELTHVINFELPTDVEHYIHRAGRCGRLGREGLVVNFATKETKFVLRRFAKRLGIELPDCEIRDGQLYMRKIGDVEASGAK